MISNKTGICACRIQHKTVDDLLIREGVFFKLLCNGTPKGAGRAIVLCIPSAC